MGYRSEVALGLCPEADQLLKANAEMIPDLAELIRDSESNVPERYFWSHTKWYRDFPEVETMDEAEEVAKRWAPYRTMACWYLWRTLDPIPVEY